MLLVLDLQTLWISPLPTAAKRATHCTRTLSHWHMDGTQVMSKGLKPSGPESHTSIVLVASHRCRTLQQLFTTSPFSFPFFFFFKLNLSHGLLPLLMRDGRRERWAICTTLSWIVLRCLAVAAVTDDRLRSFACVFTPPKKQRHKRSGRERWDTTLKQKKKKEKKMERFPEKIIELSDRLWQKTWMWIHEGECRWGTACRP